MKRLFLTSALITMLCASAFAIDPDPTQADRRGLVSKYYTDSNYASLTNFNTLSTTVGGKQDKISATTNTYVYNQSTNPSADGSVVTTGATDGTTGQRGIANQAVYTTENNVTTLSNGHWVANVEFVETKQDKKVCAGYEPGHDNDPSYCWLWVLPN